jgi:hypothetical protein
MLYPEHEKLKAIKDKSQAIGEFIDWLESEKHVQLCTLDAEGDEYVPQFTPRVTLLAQFFGNAGN